MVLKDIDTIIQHFIRKCVQVIVQSRLGTERTQTRCNPNGNDLFNLDITDIKDVLDQTNNCLKHISNHSPAQNLFFLKNDWKICCEISLKNSDGITIVLEYWTFSNSSLNHQINEKDVQDGKLSQLVHQIFIRMSNVIKSLIVLTRSTPAYRLSSKGQSAESYVICYRVIQAGDNCNGMQTSDQSNHYSPMKTFGTVKSPFNELSLSLVYRTDMSISSESEMKNLAKIEEKEYESNEFLLSLKDDHFKPEIDKSTYMFDIIKPLNPAFATKNSDDGGSNTDLNTPFASLLPLAKKDLPEKMKISQTPPKERNMPERERSKPMSIPGGGSNESFVFVELNAPFASDENVLNPFFYGPSPTFVTSVDENNDIDALSLQLAELESQAPQIDSFVESICISESEDFKLET